MKNIFALGLVVVLTTPALAGEVDIPNQFSAGTRAVAAQVNANFSAVENAIDDNARRIVEVENGILSTGVSVRVGGELVGRYLGVSASYKEVVVADSAGGGTERVSTGANLLIASNIRVISPTGYLFNVSTSDFASGRLAEGELDYGILLFDSVDCEPARSCSRVSHPTWVPVKGRMNTGTHSASCWAMTSARAHTSRLLWPIPACCGLRPSTPWTPFSAACRTVLQR